GYRRGPWRPTPRRPSGAARRFSRSYRLRLSELAEFAVRIAAIAQDLGGVLAQTVRRRRSARGAARHLEACAQHADAAIHAGNFVEDLQQPPMHDLRGVECLWHAQDPAGGYAGAIQQRFPFRSRPALERALELRGELGTMAFAALALREARIAHQVFAPHCLRQRLELPLLVGGDVEETRLRPDRAGRGGGEVIVADRSGFLACHEVVGDDPSHSQEGRVQTRVVASSATSPLL